MARRKILFVTYGGGHVRMLVPLIHALRRGHDVDIEVLGLTTAASVLVAQGIPCLGFRDFLTPADRQALAWGDELAAGHASALVSREETVAYLGLSFADLVEEHGLAAARELLEQRGRGAFLPVRTLGRVLRRLRPDLVVTTNSPRAEQASVLAARRAGIPALCIVDLFAIEEIKYMGPADYADRICVLDEAVRARFLAAGRRPEEILVTGNPAFDALANPELAQAGQQLRASLGGEKVIFFPSQPEPARHRITGEVGDPQLPRRVQAALQAIVARHEDWRLVVRPHPSEEPAAFQPALRTVISPPSQRLGEVLHAADAVAVLNSTVGYEAALLGKPLVHLPLSIYRDEADYTAMGLGCPAAQLDGLEMALHLVLSGRWRPSIRLAPPGRATDAVVAAILGLLGQGAGTPPSTN